MTRSHSNEDVNVASIAASHDVIDFPITQARPFSLPASDVGGGSSDAILPGRSDSSYTFPIVPRFFTAMINSTDLQDVIRDYTHQVNYLLSDDTVARLQEKMGRLGMIHYIKFTDDLDQKDLELAIKYMGTAIDLIENKSPVGVDLTLLFYCRACALHNQFLISDNLNDLEKAILHFTKAVELVPQVSAPKFPNKSQCHMGLASALQARFERLGRVIDVDDTITHFTQALDNTFDFNIPAINSSLGIAYQSRFDRLGESEDLDKASQILRRSIELTPKNDSSLPSRLNNLGLSLQSRFELNGDTSKLLEAIEVFHRAVVLTSSTHPEWLSNFGNACRIWVEVKQSLEDCNYLSTAITHLELAVELAEADSSNYHESLPKYLAKLAMCFISKTRLEPSEVESIDKAILLFERALAITPENRDSQRSTLLLHYGDAFQMRYDRSPGSTLNGEDVSDAMEQFQACSKLRHGPIITRLRAAIRWAQLAHRSGNRDTAMTAYKDAIQLLPQAAWIGQSVSSRRHILATHPATLAADAAACAIERRMFNRAIELLEQGRTIFWMQALQLRTDLTGLSEVNPGLARELEETAEELESGTFEDSLNTYVRENQINAEHSAQYHRRLAERWQKLVDEVRKIRGWQNFLKPQTFVQLQDAAKAGPVIIANASRHRCDALIVLESGPPQHVPLTTASFKTLTKLGLSINHNHLTLTKFNAILRTLWESVIEPISAKITALFAHKNGRTRVWWCPTGPLTFLPLHMAGASAGALKTSTDDFIPSYTANLGSLIRARTPRTTTHPKWLLVGLADTPGLSRLPGVDVEIRNISQRARDHNIPTKTLSGQNATMNAVRECLPAASWVHFACHGFSGSEPFDSALALFDGSLKLATIVQHDLPIADFACSSACMTAAGLKDLPEESLHLSAGWQFAGFRSVIGTMWSISDSIAVHVTDEVYCHLWRRGGEYVDSSEASEALDLAVRKLVSESKSDAQLCRPTARAGSKLTEEEKDKIITTGRLIPFVHFGI